MRYSTLYLLHTAQYEANAIPYPIFAVNHIIIGSPSGYYEILSIPVTLF